MSAWGIISQKNHTQRYFEMAAVTAAVVVAGAAVATTVNSRNAQRKAANAQKEANRLSANDISNAGKGSDIAIAEAQQRAAETVGIGEEEATGRILPFTEGAGQSFDAIQSQIINGLPISGPLADSIRAKSVEFVQSRPELFNLSGPVQNEVQRQADIAVSGVTPGLQGNQLAGVQQGIAAAGDVAGIRSRSTERLADIVSAGSSQRASALAGAAPQLAQLSRGSSDAALLGEVAGQKSKTEIAETLAQLAGRTL